MLSSAKMALCNQDVQQQSLLGQANANRRASATRSIGFFAFLCLCQLASGSPAQSAAGIAAAADGPLPDQAAGALRRAVDFYSRQVASHGGYVYRYSADLAKREGEGKTGPDTVWVQPPGTPAVGMAYLDAFERTGEACLLDAAKAAGECLILGQLRSGVERIHRIRPGLRKKHAYRVDPPTKKPGRNWSTFDDDKSQSAIRFLSRLDKALGFNDAPSTRRSRSPWMRC